MKVKLFIFLIIFTVLIIGCSKPKNEFSYTLESTVFPTIMRVTDLLWE